jgi:hypothetical protein
MPKNATMEQRIAWHTEHVKHCGCRPMPEGVKQAIAENASAKKAKKVVTKVFKFEAKIKDAGGGGAYVEFPHDTKEIFGTRGRIKVKATFDGHPYRGSLVPMGGPCHLMPILKSIREAIGKQPGDKVKVAIQQDTEERTVSVPQDFKKALTKNKAAREFFEKSSHTCRREYVNWIEEAKKQETRDRRVAKAIEMLAEGKRYS